MSEDKNYTGRETRGGQERTEGPSKITINIPGITDIMGSVWAKVVTILAAISMVIGIVLEIQSLVGGFYGVRKSYYDMRKSSADMCDAKTRAIVTSIYGVTQPYPTTSMHVQGWSKESINGKTGEELFKTISDECSQLLAK
ncbi:MAG: hypothetical protein ACLQOQ_20930 [Beijerinckiaceae bacterium]